ncbi:MAG: CoA-binding protein [Bacteroidota bacterium]|nr:CoA-binding protein [Bacteroidota bacterium]
MKKTLVIGASLKEERYSNMAIKLLRTNNIDVLAVGLREGSVADVKINKDKTVFENIHTVTMYVNPQRQSEFYDYVIALKPQRVIFNPGTENQDFIDLLNKNNIEIVENCTLVMLNSGIF